MNELFKNCISKKKIKYKICSLECFCFQRQKFVINVKKNRIIEIYVTKLNFSTFAFTGNTFNMNDFKKQKVDPIDAAKTKIHKNTYEDVELDAYSYKDASKKADLFVDSDKKYRQYEYADKKNNFKPILDESVVLKNDSFKVSLT